MGCVNRHGRKGHRRPRGLRRQDHRPGGRSLLERHRPLVRRPARHAVDEDQARRLFETFAVAAPGAPLWQAAAANFNPRTEDKVDTRNPDRGPMLIVSGEKDHTVPHTLSHAAYTRQQKNPGVTEFTEIPGRGHALTIDDGWQEVADTALTFIRRFAPR
jgi:pimeloyl-ACP methyl ester carboxylesterase